MKTTRFFVAVAIATLPVIAAAQKTAKPAKPAKQANSAASLRAEAKITESAARDIALKNVPGGTVKKMELEREKGAIVYSFDVTVPGKTGIEELLIDANSGKVISREHETPKMEKREARKEARGKAEKAEKGEKSGKK